MPTVLITGCDRGLGLEFARQYAAAGCRVHATCLDPAGVKGVHAIEGDVRVVKLDISDHAAIDRLASEIAGEPIDILVSNAGIIMDRPFTESTDEDWVRSIEVNLTGFFNMARAALPHMIERRSGRVIATGSCITEVADFGGNKYSVCTASKGGITMMLRPIAAEAAPYGVTVNSVSPGYIATEMLGQIDAEGLKSALRLVPMGRYGKPEEIAAAMAFLASDEAGYITGQTLRVNGGLSMG